jgi:two-component system alkaline phosphatase synthesis response regulator PhoP
LFLIEDDPGLTRALKDFLGSEGYNVEVATDGAVALDIALAEYFDLIILDVMLPTLGGFEVCRELRARDIDTPVLMLTARDRVNDKILGFRCGADDYLTKPFDMNELCVRLEALIRRSSKSERDITRYVFGNLQVDLAELQILKDGRKIELSEREGRLLRYLIRHRRTVISRDTLLEHVWGYNTMPYTRTVDVHILRLRQKIEEDPRSPKFIITVHGLGYRFDM